MGFLVPPWYESETPDRSQLNDASLVLGATIPLAVFTFVKNIMQTQTVFERRRTFTPFVIMCWAEWVSSVALAVLSYLFLSGMVPASFWTFFFMISLWTVEMQCILQIIINRVALIAQNPTEVRRIRIIVFVIVSLINLTGYPIWIPARLQINPFWIHINFWWDRSEKVLYALVDIALNGYFMYNVRTKLIQMGLTKYKKLLRANIAMACVSVGMDILVLGSMSLPSGVIYAQFHPLQFLVKLLIELFMADLIAKIVREDNRMNTINTDTGGTTVQEMEAIMAGQGPGATDSFSQALERFGATQSGHHMNRKTAADAAAAAAAATNRRHSGDGGSRGRGADDIADEVGRLRLSMPHFRTSGGFGDEELDRNGGCGSDVDAAEKGFAGNNIPDGIILQTTTTVVTTEPLIAGTWADYNHDGNSSNKEDEEAERKATMRAIQECEAMDNAKPAGVHVEDMVSNKAPP
ncbi:hypothetical protein Micbo1qcDRAFT_236150 [Microdochium bolleyi]|uniref:Uncharacterized protein n=1 Tax=Microdochium bolleyi TaxID=196109 RepID=A0A136ISL9_9PEZI|nr:hypothetical protein Micbo1qcDRAFT_236150 [Microdochium bolleyi]